MEDELSKLTAASLLTMTGSSPWDEPCLVKPGLASELSSSCSAPEQYRCLHRGSEELLCHGDLLVWRLLLKGHCLPPGTSQHCVETQVDTAGGKGAAPWLLSLYLSHSSLCQPSCQDRIIKSRPTSALRELVHSLVLGTGEWCCVLDGARDRAVTSRELRVASGAVILRPVKCDTVDC